MLNKQAKKERKTGRRERGCDPMTGERESLSQFSRKASERQQENSILLQHLISLSLFSSSRRLLLSTERET